jgi:hypothetical protein
LPECAFYRDDVVQMMALAFAGKTNQAQVTSTRIINEQSDKVERFFGYLAAYPEWAKPGWSEGSLLSLPTVNKALAQLFYALGDERSQDFDRAGFQQFMDALATQKLNFHPGNALWHLYDKTDQERHNLDPKLDDYLTPDVGRTPFGVWIANGMLRPGSGTRDVMRYFGDLIRYELKLQPRKKLASMIEKLAHEGKLPPLGPKPKMAGAA